VITYRWREPFDNVEVNALQASAMSRSATTGGPFYLGRCGFMPANAGLIAL
jgi:hypothetical protein